jgi:hypothetical protein
MLVWLPLSNGLKSVLVYVCKGRGETGGGRLRQDYSFVTPLPCMIDILWTHFLLEVSL